MMCKVRWHSAIRNKLHSGDFAEFAEELKEVEHKQRAPETSVENGNTRKLSNCTDFIPHGDLILHADFMALIGQLITLIRKLMALIT